VADNDKGDGMDKDQIDSIIGVKMTIPRSLRLEGFQGHAWLCMWILI